MPGHCQVPGQQQSGWAGPPQARMAGRDPCLGCLWLRPAVGWPGHLLASRTVILEHIKSHCTREGLHRVPVTMCGTYTVPWNKPVHTQ